MFIKLSILNYFMEGDDYGEKDAPFNMAIATLRRLDVILQQIKNLNLRFSQDSPEKQKAHISLVRDFYIQATPLFSETDLKDLKEIEKELLNFSIDKKSKIKSGSQKIGYVFDVEKEKRLNEILIDLQVKLKRYFMPKGADPSKAIHFK